MNIDLSEPLGENSIVITDGMAWILYTDQGPAGISKTTLLPLCNAMCGASGLNPEIYAKLMDLISNK